MVVEVLEQERTDRLFQALADATRRDIVTRTMQTEISVSALARLYPMSFAAVQKHVAVLERAELVTKRRHGREQLVSGNVATVRRATRLLDRIEAHWRARLDRFAEVLAEPPDEPSDDPSNAAATEQPAATTPDPTDHPAGATP